MNFLKISKLSIFFCLFIFSIDASLAQDQEIENDLFYCNENIDIKFIWPISDSFFIANVWPQTDKGFQSNLLLLFDRSHLIVDTLYVQSGLINGITPLDKNRFILSTTLNTFEYKITNNKITPFKNQKYPGGLAALLSFGFNQYTIGSFFDLKIGYETKAKNRIKKRSKKNIPRYYFEDKDKKRTWINSGKEDIKGDQWTSFADKSLFDLGEVTVFKNDIYFNIPMIGRCYILNAKTHKIKTILYPEIGAKSWFLTVDKVRGIHYLVGNTHKNSFAIYYVDIEKNKKSFVREVEGFYDAIINDKVLLKKQIKENGKKFNCFYLTPLYPN